MVQRVERAERSDLNVLRGLAGAYMVIHHVWAQFQPAVGRLGESLVFIGSCAPVIFFFVTGVGYGIKGAQRGALLASALKKVAVLLLADQLLFWRLQQPAGLDFLGFIGLSTLVLEWVSRRRRPVVVALGLTTAIIFLRYGLGAKAIIGRLGLADATWLLAAIGAKDIGGIAYPACPWLVYPLIGFALARAGAERAIRPVLGLSALSIASALFATMLIGRGYVVFRWGTVSLAFFALSFAILGGSLWLAFLIDRLPPLARAISLRGIASLAVVPLHYWVIEVAAQLHMAPTDGQRLASLTVLLGVLAFAGAKLAARLVQALADAAQARALSSALWATVLFCAALLLFGREVNPLLRATCMALGQLALCALLVVAWPFEMQRRAQSARLRV